MPRLLQDELLGATATSLATNDATTATIYTSVYMSAHTDCISAMAFTEQSHALRCTHRQAAAPHEQSNALLIKSAQIIFKLFDVDRENFTSSNITGRKQFDR